MTGQPTLIVNPESPVPIYRQVVDGLRSLLVEGSLKEGDSLPTVRELGLELGVHFNTVAEAYRVLAAEGWLDLRRRRGVTVLARTMPSPQPDTEQYFRASLRQLVAQMRSQGLPVHCILQEFQRLTKELST